MSEIKLKSEPTVSVEYVEEQLSQNFIKIYADTHLSKTNIKDKIEILLKVSGVWDNPYEYGITFRFFFIHPSEMT